MTLVSIKQQTERRSKHFFFKYFPAFRTCGICCISKCLYSINFIKLSRFIQTLQQSVWMVPQELWGPANSCPSPGTGLYLELPHLMFQPEIRTFIFPHVPHIQPQVKKDATTKTCFSRRIHNRTLDWSWKSHLCHCLGNLGRKSGQKNYENNYVTKRAIFSSMQVFLSNIWIPLQSLRETNICSIWPGLFASPSLLGYLLASFAPPVFWESSS